MLNKERIYRTIKIILLLSVLFILLPYPIFGTLFEIGDIIEAGHSFNNALPISEGSYQGFLESTGEEDYYCIYVYMGYTINITMIPPDGADFELFLYYTPNLQYPTNSSTNSGDSKENVSYTALVSGNYFIRIVVQNGSGKYLLNINIIDIEPPRIWVISPSEGSYIGIRTNIMGTSYDFASGIQKLEIKIDDLPWESTSGTTTWNYLLNTTNFILDSYHTIFIRAIDNANNSKIVNIDVKVDNVLPLISIIYPTNGTKVKSNNIYLIFIASDEGSGIDHYEIKLDKGSWISRSNTNHTFTELANGPHTIFIKVIDNAGNSNESYINFIIDTDLLFGLGWIVEAFIICVIIFIVVLFSYNLYRKKYKNLN